MIQSDDNSIHNSTPADWSSGSRLTYTCDACHAAFDPPCERCPYCDTASPSSGWPTISTRPDPWLGRCLADRYRLVRRLGRGATGAVYRARRPHVEGSWAVKMISTAQSGLRTELAGRSMRERVVREVRVLSSIANPHVVDFEDLLELPDGVVAVVMDFVDGSTLASEMGASAPFSTRRAARIALDIASGLCDIHARGIVHRDLKPANVMLHYPGTDREFAEIIDFGIARFEGESEQTVGFIGTPRYTSPEQARGDRAGPAGDIYNLGMLLHHMLVGRPPFTHHEVDELLAAHSSAAAPSLSEASEWGSFPEPLEDLVGKMLEKRPADRPCDMQRVIDRLRRFADGDTSPAAVSEAEPTGGGDASPESFRDGTSSPAVPLSGINIQKPDFPRSSDPSPGDRTPRGLFDFNADGAKAFRDDENAVHLTSPSGSHDSIVLNPSESVTAVACQSGHLLVGRADGTVTGVDLENRSTETLLGEPPGTAVSAVAEAGEAGLIVIGFEGGNVLFRATTADGYVWRHVSDGPAVVDVAVHGDGGVAVARQNNTTELYNVSAQEREAIIDLHHDRPIDEILYSEDGYLLGVRFTCGDVTIVETVEGREINDLPADQVPENTAEIFGQL